MKCCTQPSTSPESYLDTEVIIIGNGPAGLALSAFLSGWIPSYDKTTAHPNEAIHSKLAEHADESLFDQDLSWLDNISNYYTNDLRPMSVLYDCLARPGSDIGDLNSSSLRWKHDPSRAIPHIVVGETSIGGSWNGYDDEMLAVSFSSLLDLPAFSFADWLGSTSRLFRPSTVAVRKYMVAYAKAVGIKNNITCHFKVTHIGKYRDEAFGVEYWEVRGQYKGESVIMKSRKVVLACGMNRNATLDIEGEYEEKRIAYDVVALKKILSLPFTETELKVVVIGSGISAADAILHCLDKNIPVVHVMRRSDKQLRYIQLSRLSNSIYPEYSKVYRLMIGKSNDRLYTRRTSTSVVAIKDGTVILNSVNGQFVERFRALCAAIGKKAELPIMDEVYTFKDYVCSTDPSLMCVGSLVNDKLVRYLIGGCLQIARIIVSSPT